MERRGKVLPRCCLLTDFSTDNTLESAGVDCIPAPSDYDPESSALVFKSSFNNKIDLIELVLNRIMLKALIMVQTL